MTDDDSGDIKDHPVVSREEWLAARTAFLAKEKEFTRLRDELSRQRRELPWEKVDKQYATPGPTWRGLRVMTTPQLNRLWSTFRA